MSSSSRSFPSFHFTHQGCSGWSYALSDTRSQSIPSQPPFLQSSLSSSPHSPPHVFPHLPTEIDKGVWLLDNDILYGCDWPPVQHYLSQVRKEMRIVDPPSHLVWTLAALDVLYNPHDVAHWLFWSGEVYERHAKSVDVIALHKPRLIKSRVPWTGRLEYQSTVSQIQEKFVYVHVNCKWYPTEPKHDKKLQRTTRSTGEPTLKTGRQFFGLDTGCACIICTGPKKEDLHKKRTPVKPASKRRAPKSPSRAARKAPTPDIGRDSATVESNSATLEGSPIITLPEIHSKPKSALSPPLPSISSPKRIADSSRISLTLPPSSPSHSRSTSQSSVATLIGNSRCSSVESSDTAIDGPSSKKRKAMDTDDDDDHLAKDSDLALGKITRGRVLVLEHRETDPGESRSPPRTCTSILDARPAPSRLKPRAKRARV